MSEGQISPPEWVERVRKVGSIIVAEGAEAKRAVEAKRSLGTNVRNTVKVREAFVEPDGKIGLTKTDKTVSELDILSRQLPELLALLEAGTGDTAREAAEEVAQCISAVWAEVHVLFESLQRHTEALPEGYTCTFTVPTTPTVLSPTGSRKITPENVLSILGAIKPVYGNDPDHFSALVDTIGQPFAFFHFKITDAITWLMAWLQEVGEENKAYKGKADKPVAQDIGAF